MYFLFTFPQYGIHPEGECGAYFYLRPPDIGLNNFGEAENEKTKKTKFESAIMLLTCSGALDKCLTMVYK